LAIFRQIQCWKRALFSRSRVPGLGNWPVRERAFVRAETEIPSSQRVHSYCFLVTVSRDVCCNHPLGGPTSVCVSLCCVHLGSGYGCLSSPLPTQVRPRESPPLRRDAYVTDGVAAVRRCGIGIGNGIGVRSRAWVACGEKLTEMRKCWSWWHMAHVVAVHGFRERLHSGGSAKTLRSYSLVLQVQNGPLSHRVHLGTGSIAVKYVH
jgi:hypothetical protein